MRQIQDVKVCTKYVSLCSLGIQQWYMCTCVCAHPGGTCGGQRSTSGFVPWDSSTFSFEIWLFTWTYGSPIWLVPRTLLSQPLPSLESQTAITTASFFVGVENGTQPSCLYIMILWWLNNLPSPTAIIFKTLSQSSSIYSTRAFVKIVKFPGPITDSETLGIRVGKLTFPSAQGASTLWFFENHCMKPNMRLEKHVESGSWDILYNANSKTEVLWYRH